MSLQEKVEQKVERYKLAPHITLGKLKGSLIGVKAQSVTKIDGEGVIEFIESIFEFLVRDNGISINEIEQIFDVERDQLEYVLEFLVENRLCVKSEEDFNLTTFLAYERAGSQVEVADILHRIKTHTVEIFAREDNVLAETLKSNLKESGINVFSQGELDVKPSIRIAVGTSHLDPMLEEINDIALNDCIPWLCLVPYDGQTAWVGPFFIPHQSACLHCYNLRKSANFADDVFRSELMNIRPINTVNHPVYNQPINLVQTGIASNLITEWVTLMDYAPSAVPGGFTTVNLDDNGVSFNSHRVYRVPRCPKCSPTADTGFPQVWHHGEVGNYG